jgi:hypothetical protein
MCAEGAGCTRKFCFFSHSELELRHVPTCKPVAPPHDRQSAQALAAAALPLVRSAGGGSVPDASSSLPASQAAAFMGSMGSWDMLSGLAGAGWGGGRGGGGGGGGRGGGAGSQRRSSFIMQPRTHGPARDHTKPLRRASDTAMLAPGMAQQLMQLPPEALSLLVPDLAGYPAAMQQAALQQLLAAGQGLPAAGGTVADLTAALQLQLQLMQQASASSSAAAASQQLAGMLGATAPAAAPLLPQHQQHQQHQHLMDPQALAAASSASGVTELNGLLQQLQVGRQATGYSPEAQLQALMQLLAEQHHANQTSGSSPTPATTQGMQLMEGLPGAPQVQGLSFLALQQALAQQQQQQQGAGTAGAGHFLPSGLHGGDLVSQQLHMNLLLQQQQLQHQHQHQQLQQHQNQQQAGVMMPAISQATSLARCARRRRRPLLLHPPAGPGGPRPWRPLPAPAYAGSPPSPPHPLLLPPSAGPLLRPPAWAPSRPARWPTRTPAPPPW